MKLSKILSICLPLVVLSACGKKDEAPAANTTTTTQSVGAAQSCSYNQVWTSQYGCQNVMGGGGFGYPQGGSFQPVDVTMPPNACSYNNGYGGYPYGGYGYMPRYCNSYGGYRIVWFYYNGGYYWRYFYN